MNLANFSGKEDLEISSRISSNCSGKGRSRSVYAEGFDTSEPVREPSEGPYGS